MPRKKKEPLPQPPAGSLVGATILNEQGPVQLTYAPAPPPVTEKVRRPRAPRPEPPNPTVIAFQQQLVPLVEKREIIQQHVRHAQKDLQAAQMELANHQQALQDTEAAINYRMDMIARLTGQPAYAPMQPAPSGLGYPQTTLLENLRGGTPLPFGYDQYNPISIPQAQAYAGGEVNLMGNPNIPPGITSIPAPQNQRYASGYVPTGENNPRSESALDVKEDPATREVILAMQRARAAV